MDVSQQWWCENLDYDNSGGGGRSVLDLLNTIYMIIWQIIGLYELPVVITYEKNGGGDNYDFLKYMKYKQLSNRKHVAYQHRIISPSVRLRHLNVIANTRFSIRQ